MEMSESWFIVTLILFNCFGTVAKQRKHDQNDSQNNSQNVVFVSRKK